MNPRIFYQILFCLFFSFPLRGEEINDAFVMLYEGQKISRISIKSSVKLKTTNYHPGFRNEGDVLYEGILVKDFLPPKIALNERVYFVDATQPGTRLSTESISNYVIGLSAKEAIGYGNILANKKNGRVLDRANMGIQIIYSQETIKNYPHLTHRNYWAWWLGSVVVGDAPYSFETNAELGPSIEVFSTAPFPLPYGRSSSGEISPIFKQKLRKLKVSKGDYIHVICLNGAKIALPVHESLNYFVSDCDSKNFEMMRGGINIYGTVFDDSGKISNFVHSTHFIKSFEISREKAV